MLCLKAEALGHEHDEHDLYPPPAPLILSINFGSMIYKYLRKGKGSWKSSPSSRLSNGSCSSLSFDGPALEEAKTQDGESERQRGRKMWAYRSQLEQDIKELQKELEEEIDLHLALASAIEQSTAPLPISLCQLPDKAQELLANVAVLEITVSKLEKELAALHFQLSQERNERCLAEYHLQHLPLSSPYSASKELISRPCIKDKHEMEIVGLLQGTNVIEECNTNSFVESLGHHPNLLSEEMVRCMRNIFLCLADTSKFSSFDCMASPRGHLSHSLVATLADSSVMPELALCSSFDLEHEYGGLEREIMFNPYQAHGKENWTKDIGSYSKAAEVSWMSVGEKQLEYAARALKRFRLLVEQLAKVNPACMSHSERLAFWINLYNALMMHAYLAYGVPRSDIKFFSFMLKAAYTVGGYSFSALDIEYCILKMKPPAHRPQIALLHALHKFKIPEDQRKCSIENPEPLIEFALSCGMRSSPAVRIFKPANVTEDIKNSLRDYIRASVGISNKGKLLVPKLLHCYAKGIVDDTLVPDWICQFLSPEQAAMVRDCSSPCKQRRLSARNFTVLPFDSRFRYLFLPDKWKLPDITWSEDIVS